MSSESLDRHDDQRIKKKIEGYTCKSCTGLLQASEGGMEGEEYNSGRSRDINMYHAFPNFYGIGNDMPFM